VSGDLREAIRENLAQIEADHAAAGCYFNESVPALVQALGVVVALHASFDLLSGRQDCKTCFLPWPCETLIAIAQALEVEETAR
jgi:hypothetical protein